jgi:GNAT superfamily N-acetyltransferase
MSTAPKTPRRIPMTVTFLEMKQRPSGQAPPQPRGKIAILRAEKPSVHFYRYLYDTVGKDYVWVDRKKLDDEALANILDAPTLELYVLYAEGAPAGIAELDFADPKVAHLAYFGLMPEAIGRGLGSYFLYQSCAICWARPITNLVVNTCTLDHPRALPMYQRVGFVPYAREDRYIELP